MISVAFLPYFFIVSFVSFSCLNTAYMKETDEFHFGGEGILLRGSLVGDASSSISSTSNVNEGHGRIIHINSALDPITYGTSLIRAVQQLLNTVVPASELVQFNISTNIFFETTANNLPNPCHEEGYGNIMICNNNYGATPWSSIDVTISRAQLVQRDIIKINDYYLKQAAPEYKQYTLCHQIGKSLLHWNISIHTDVMLTCMDIHGYYDVHRFLNLPSTQSTMPSAKLKQSVPDAKLPSLRLSQRRVWNADCCSFNDKVCGGMAEYCGTSRTTCEDYCAGFWLDGATQQKRLESNCTGLFETCTINSDCCSSLCEVNFYQGYSTCVPGSPSTSPSKRPTSTPTKAVTGGPTKFPITMSPTASPTSRPTPHPTYLPCCSYNRKLCGGMAAFCSTSQSTCEHDCSGFWLINEQLQAVAQSNCTALFEMCLADADCCGHSSCDSNVYLGYSVCMPGPPTTSPTKQPTSPPTIASTASPTKRPIRVTAAPTTSPCCSYDNEHCGGMQKLCDSDQTICENSCGGVWIHGKIQRNKDPSQVVVHEPTLPPSTQADNSVHHDRNSIIDCYCPQTCTSEILNSLVGFQTCKDYIQYQMKEYGTPEIYACVRVSESSGGACGGDNCNPYRCPGSQLRHLRQLEPSSNTMKARKPIHRREVSLHLLNVTKIEGEIGYDNKSWGQRVEIGSSSLRYALPITNSTTRYTVVSLSLIPAIFV